MRWWHTLVSKKNIKKTVLVIFLAASLLVYAAMKIYDYYYVTTDNAYVNANIVQIAPRVTGQVVALHITNNQYVQENQALFDLGEESFKATLAKANAQYAIDQAALTNAQNTANRTNTLAQKQYVSEQDNENVATTLQTAEASLSLAKATLDQANLDLAWTHIKAPTSGWVTNVSLRVGDVVAANQPLFALISDGEFWVDANFKETELEYVKPGQLAMIYVDMYPDHPFKGVVQSISGGTGSAFSLLPPQNATGNWVKVTQRVPVRIRVLNVDPKYPLRIGTSASVRISLKKFHATTTA